MVMSEQDVSCEWSKLKEYLVKVPENVTKLNHLSHEALEKALFDECINLWKWLVLPLDSL
eukprot:6475158-Amphidinium_carterae.2